VGGGRKTVPLTHFQRVLLALLAPSRSPSSYLAGGSALHFAPNSSRYSRDLDLFHDTVEQVSEAYAADSAILAAADYAVKIAISQPGFIRAIVSKDQESTQIDWARDSAWRFMPVVKDPLGGYVLHDVDVATNKILALAGRDEPRDFVDILFVMDHILPLGPLVWGAVAKDPGYSPLSLLEMIRRRGKYQRDDMDRLDLARPLDLAEAKRKWVQALTEAERFVMSRPPAESGCLYFSTAVGQFVEPKTGASLDAEGIVCHFGRPGGILPKASDQGL
jgi:hypothetical protein